MERADISDDVVTNQALVRRKDDWERWPLKGATFIPTENGLGMKEAAEEGAEGVACAEAAATPVS